MIEEQYIIEATMLAIEAGADLSIAEIEDWAKRLKRMDTGEFDRAYDEMKDNAACNCCNC